MIFLATPVGNCILSLLDIDRKSELSVDKDNELYKFFSNNQSLQLDSLVSQTNSEKISIVGYTEYKEKYKNNSSYKFLKNFRKKEGVQQNDKGDKAQNDIKISLSIKKIVGEFEISDSDKKIIINISEDAKEGLITSSSYYNPNKIDNQSKVSLNGADYIVFGDESYNKDFDVTDADKQIMSESKGKLTITDEEKEKNILKYRVSTYKGQSGSPVFLRYKRISNSKKGEYVYQFVGLHSRRGPSIGPKLFYESDKMTALTEILLTSDNQPRFGNIVTEKVKTKEMLKNTESVVTVGETNEVGKEKQQINEIIAINGACDYNLAVNVLGKKVAEISSIVHDKLSKLRDENGNLPYEEIKSDFIYTKLLLNNQVKLEGVFKKQIPLSFLFFFGSKILNVEKEYILLQDPLGFNFQNYNFDHDKKLCRVMDDPNCISVAFELNLNIKKYGETIAEKILQKFLENYDLEESQLKHDFKKYIKALFHSIFREISKFESIPLTYGKLFKKVRKIILKKLGITEQVNPH